MQWLLEWLYTLIGVRIWVEFGQSMKWIYDTGASWDLEVGAYKEVGSLEGGVKPEYCTRSIGAVHITLMDGVFNIRIGG